MTEQREQVVRGWSWVLTLAAIADGSLILAGASTNESNVLKLST